MFSGFLRTIVLVILATASVGHARESLNVPETYIYRASAEGILSLDVYASAANDSPYKRPALIFFHGGAWSGGTKGMFSQQATMLVEKSDLKVLSVDYPTRRNPIESTEAALAAVCWVIAHADEMRIDRDRIAVAGGSAGGQLALSVALRSHLSPPECGTIPRPYARAVVLFNPALDLKGEWEAKFGRRLVEVSPIDNLDKTLPPTLILQGTRDRITPVETARNFVARAKREGVEKVELIEYEGRGHGFFNSAETRDLHDTVSRTILFLTQLGWLH